MTENRQIAIVSFGSTQIDARERALGAVEKAAQEAFPESRVVRSFTSGMVIRIIEKKEGLHILNPEETLREAAGQGVQHMVLQPTHIMPGLEYEKMLAMAEPYRNRFDSLKIGKPLLSSEEDVQRLIRALRQETEQYDDGKTAIVLVGHGTEHMANQIYSRMQDSFAAKHLENYLVGTIEASPSLDDVREICRGRGYSRVVLLPMLVVAGDHAVHDIAGDEEDSWKCTLERDGYEVLPVKKGLGEYPPVQEIFLDHIRDVIA